MGAQVMTIFLCVVTENDFCDFWATLIGFDVSLNQKALRCHNDDTRYLQLHVIQHGMETAQVTPLRT